MDIHMKKIRDASALRRPSCSSSISENSWVGPLPFECPALIFEAQIPAQDF